MTIKVEHVNHINLTYSGNGKWTVTWAGWPSEGFKTQRRTIHTDYTYAGEVAPRVAELFCEWLDTGPMGDDCKSIITLVTCGYIKGDEYTVGVQTSWERK